MEYKQNLTVVVLFYRFDGLFKLKRIKYQKNIKLIVENSDLCANFINMPHETVLECTGKCQMVETYKSINRALTSKKEQSDFIVFEY